MENILKYTAHSFIVWGALRFNQNHYVFCMCLNLHYLFPLARVIHPTHSQTEY